uniref:hypothetical protein n=1 Tax=Pararhizobium sp. IMCC3301 TaxID=3067904 RepID=UPI0027423A43|nr:hypothetical protein [Pararhizobium sp. IMCC3301]
MTDILIARTAPVLVAIDISKERHEVLIVENNRDAEDHCVTDSVDWYSNFNRR